ncbi:MAG: HD domain-containing protein [Spirochaetes bacterium]|nr:HD domain-containing protein [Spirochaetota bacterium]
MNLQYKKVKLYEEDDYKDYNIYYFDSIKNIYKLLKKPGITLSSVCSESERENFYYFVPERLNFIETENIKLNSELKTEIKKENILKVKNIIIKIVNNHFSEPRSGTLKGIENMINIIIDEYFGQYAILTNFARMSYKDYTTTIHSINVMSLTLGLSFFLKFPKNKVYNYGISGLLHDIGKTEISDTILKAERKLNQQEFEIIKKHPQIGVDILKDYSFPTEVIKGCIEHHERLDGSGYPNGIKEEMISEIGKILAIIDPFEAITSVDRPYKRKMPVEKALEIIFIEEGNKIDKNLFTKFVKNLGIVEKIF